MSGLAMHGEIGEREGSGKPIFGEMSEAQIKEWILRKIGEYAPPAKDGTRKKMTRESAVGQVVNDFMSGKRKATPYRLGQKPVWHTSAGKRGASQNAICSLFYIVADEDNGVGRIVGIGAHRTSTTYDLFWRRPGWLVDKVLTLSD